MPKPKLIRITSVPLSLQVLLSGQLAFMAEHFQVLAVSAEKEQLQTFGTKNKLPIFPLEMARSIIY